MLLFCKKVNKLKIYVFITYEFRLTHVYLVLLQEAYQQLCVVFIKWETSEKKINVPFRTVTIYSFVYNPLFNIIITSTKSFQKLSVGFCPVTNKCNYLWSTVVVKTYISITCTYFKTWLLQPSNCFPHNPIKKFTSNTWDEICTTVCVIVLYETFLTSGWKTSIWIFQIYEDTSYHQCQHMSS